jgi:hypothetical protein
MHRVAEGVADGCDGAVHAAEVDGDVGCVGDEVAFGVEEGAGEVEALLDVDGAGGGAEGFAHVFGDGLEAVGEDFEEDGIGCGG